MRIGVHDRCESAKKAAYKRKEVVKNHVYYLKGQYGGNDHILEVIFKPKYLVKSEHWIHASIVAFCCYVIFPFGGAAGGVGSSLAREGSNPVIAVIFFILGYFFLCICCYLLIQTYGRYRLIKEIENELKVKLKPAVYQAVSGD